MLLTYNKLLATEMRYSLQIYDPHLLLPTFQSIYLSHLVMFVLCFLAVEREELALLSTLGPKLLWLEALSTLHFLMSRSTMKGKDLYIFDCLMHCRYTCICQIRERKINMNIKSLSQKENRSAINHWAWLIGRSLPISFFYHTSKYSFELVSLFQLNTGLMAV